MEHFAGLCAGAPVGAGLGLAIVRAVAEAHGGSATAENLPAHAAAVTARFIEP